MIGQTVLMELRTSWKGILIISILMALVGGGFTQLFPTMKDTLVEDLEGAAKVDIELPEVKTGNILISWAPMENANGYFILEDNRSSMLTSKLVYAGLATNVTLPYNSTETKYYAVMASVNGSELPQLVGMRSTGKGNNPFQTLIDDPSFSAFTGGRDIDIMQIKGYLSLEIFSWMWMIIGLFIAYFSVAIVTGDFEKKRMDLIFSTPLSREQYLIEKFLALLTIQLIMILVCAGGMIAGVKSIGLLNELDGNTAFLSIFSSLSFMMIIAAVGILAAVTFKNGKAGIGINFAFVFGSYMLLTVSRLSDAFEGLKYSSIMHYWDYNSMLLDGVFNYGYFFGLLAAALIILGVAIFIFKKHDIPA